MKIKDTVAKNLAIAELARKRSKRTTRKTKPPSETQKAPHESNMATKKSIGVID